MHRTVLLVLAAAQVPQVAGQHCQCDSLDFNDPNFRRCDFWGDVHMRDSWRTPNVFDFQGTGVYSYAQTTKCGGDFEMQIFQCPYSKNGNAVALGIAVKINDGDVVVISNTTVESTGNADVDNADAIGNRKIGVDVVSDDKCVRLNVNTKGLRKAPGFLHNGQLRVISEAITAEGICGAPTFGPYFVGPGSDTPDLLFPDSKFNELCDLCKAETGMVVPGCEEPGKGPPNMAPACDFLQLRPGVMANLVEDCVGTSDPVLLEAEDGGENCVAYVRLNKRRTCDDFCTSRGSECVGAVDNPNGETCVATVNSLDEVDTRKVNCQTTKFRDLQCICKKPENPAPGPTPEEACASTPDRFSLQDALNFCRSNVDFLQGIQYPGVGASPDEEEILRGCILDVCSAAPEDRDEILDNVRDQDPDGPGPGATTTNPPPVGEELYAFDFSPYPGSSSPYSPQGVVEVESIPGGITRLSWSLTGLDPACSSDCTASRCCAVIITEGRKSSLKAV